MCRLESTFLQSMNNYYPRERDDRVPGPGTFESAEELTEAGRRYFESDFPNPKRIGCPPFGTLRTVRRSGVPGDDLRAHLFTCSECFVEYSEGLLLRKNRAPVRIAGHIGGLVFQSKRVLAGAAVVLLVVLPVAVVVVVRHRPAMTAAIAREGEAARRSDGQSSNASGQSEPSPEAANDRPLASHPGDSPANKNSATHLASNYQEIDLENYAHYRGGSDQSSAVNKPIPLNSSINHMLFRLPDASPRGRYRVIIKNPRMDQTILRTDARSFDGKTLKTILNLRSLEGGQYVLCLSPEALAPFCYDVVVRH